MLNVMAEAPEAKLPELPDYVRAQGQLRLAFAKGVKATRVAELSESGGFRIKFPKMAGESAEAIIVNTAGGMTGGDALRLDVTFHDGAKGLVTTQAAEKIYKSIAGETRVAMRLDVAANATAIWAPQETILYDGARLSRSLEAEIDPSATAVLCESLVFGRLASGEVLGEAGFRDRWRIRQGGHLIFADDVRLEGAISDVLDNAAIGGGARAIATVLLVAAGAEGRIEQARAALADANLADAPCQCAASALPGLIVARFLSAEPHGLRMALNHYLSTFAGVKIPRSWLC